MQKALPPASWVQLRSASGVVSAGRRRSRFGNDGSSRTRIVTAASAFGSSAEGGGCSEFGKGTVGMAPTSRVPDLGPRLESGLAGLSSADQGIDRAEVNLTRPALAPLVLARFCAGGTSELANVNLMSEVLK
jgi:hypothetical protein